MSEKFFPTCMIILSICAAITYIIKDLHDWRHIGYWCAGAAITFCVTY